MSTPRTWPTDAERVCNNLACMVVTMHHDCEQCPACQGSTRMIPGLTARREREAAARALREARNDFQFSPGIAYPGLVVRARLDDRADRIERGES